MLTDTIIHHVAEVPQWLYGAIGFLIVTNLGAIGGIIHLIFRAGKFVAATELGIENAHHVAKLAHERIDKISNIP